LPVTMHHAANPTAWGTPSKVPGKEGTPPVGGQGTPAGVKYVVPQYTPSTGSRVHPTPTRTYSDISDLMPPQAVTRQEPILMNSHHIVPPKILHKARSERVVPLQAYVEEQQRRGNPVPPVAQYYYTVTPLTCSPIITLTLG
jgi:hypothetical protein